MTGRDHRTARQSEWHALSVREMASRAAQPGEWGRLLARLARNAYRRVTSGSAVLPPDQATQRLLWLHYRHLLAHDEALPSFDIAGFRAYSENEEDGIIQLIFAVIGTTNRKCAEIAFSYAEGSNTTNLITNWGWDGLVVEGDPVKARSARTYFRTNRDTSHWLPQIVESWITADNVNDVLAAAGIDEDIDFLSLDLDGMDYWVWKSLTITRPRLVLVEAQLGWGPDDAVTVPYDPRFVADDPGDASYSGASLAAFVRLGREKGYRLIGTIRYGYNAFFLREDIDTGRFPTVEPQECLRHPRAVEARRQRLQRGDTRPWVRV